MATAHSMQTRPGQWPQYYRDGISNDATEKVTELLQKNHEKWHMYFNEVGMHNHIAHQQLTLWALNASPKQLQKAYDNNTSYQAPMIETSSSIQSDLQDTKKFMEHVGPMKRYNDFLTFFRTEIEKTSWQEVVQRFLLAGDERANSLLARSYNGVLHPIIHLGLGIEFGSPAVVAEGLAQSATHTADLAALLLPAEALAQQNSGADTKSIAQLLDEIRDDKVLRDCVKYTDKFRGVEEGIIGRASQHMIGYLAQVRVRPEELEEKTAEMINAISYCTGGAQRSDKVLKFDFIFLHSLNCSLFFSAFLKQDWLSDADKIRLLEWKIRMDLVVYVSRHCPDIRLEELRNYQPRQPSGIEQIEDRACAYETDDGHVAKLVRALAHGAQVCQPFESKDSFRLKGDDWLQLAHLAIDIPDTPGPRYVFGCGFEEAWDGVPSKTAAIL